MFFHIKMGSDEKSIIVVKAPLAKIIWNPNHLIICKERKGERTNCNEEDGWKEQSNSRDGGVKYGYLVDKVVS